MTYDVAAVRAEFPALAEGAAHFDGPGGSQTPAVVADAVADTLRSAVANRGTVTRAEQRAEEIVAAAQVGRRRPRRRGAARHRVRPQHDPADLRHRPRAGEGVGPGRSRSW